ncbi:hypothetical protein F2Q70_00036730 [Brassica cretica]|uniref:Uncharacterized protein n=1 Tax=Brassica cretica TaxID=69181 RepID=A0A8S9G6A9_BRACR|nr:hypothetical protein F2Q68_00032022 [Brassica cretica]KAF2584646.1 hypothetical protein F2Q70_00036730 [Brassica cretica]
MLNLWSEIRGEEEAVKGVSSLQFTVPNGTCESKDTVEVAILLGRLDLEPLRQVFCFGFFSINLSKKSVRDKSLNEEPPVPTGIITVSVRSRIKLQSRL